MTLDFGATSFYSHALWYGRSETPASIADRYARYMDRLAAASPILANWQAISQRKATPFAVARRDLVTYVQKSIRRDEKGKPDLKQGFYVGGFTKEKQGFSFRGFVGQTYPSPAYNDCMLSTASGHWPDLSLMTFDLFRAATLAAITCWEPLWCTTQPSTLQPFMAKGAWFHASWFTYIHPTLLDRVAPPDLPVVEPTPDGGLLLGAAAETFDVDNPAHLAAALRIEAATRHLDDVMPVL
jgi:hypothetical protein